MMSRRKLHDEDFPESLVLGECLPPILSLEATNKCNVSCIMCDRAQHIKKTGQKSAARWLTTEKLRKDLEGVKHIREVILSASHGEPLLNRDIVEIIALLKEKKASVEIISNGSLLTKSMCEKLVDVGLNRLFISLHGARKETAEAIMHNANFDRIIQGMEELKKIKAKNSTEFPRLEIFFVAMKRNIEELSNFVSMASRLGISAVHVQSLNERQQEGLVELKGESLVSHPELLVREYEKARIIAERCKVRLCANPPYSSIIAGKELSTGCNVEKKCEKVPEGKTRYCLFPFDKPFVGIEGQVSLCCSSKGRYIRMGNISNKGFSAVWDSNLYKTIRKALLTGKDLPPYCDECERAPLADPRVIQMDRALRQMQHSSCKDAAGFVRKNKKYYPDYLKAMKDMGTSVLPYPTVRKSLVSSFKCISGNYRYRWLKEFIVKFIKAI